MGLIPSVSRNRLLWTVRQVFREVVANIMFEDYLTFEDYIMFEDFSYALFLLLEIQWNRDTL